MNVNFKTVEDVVNASAHELYKANRLLSEGKIDYPDEIINAITEQLCFLG